MVSSKLSFYHSQRNAQPNPGHLRVQNDPKSVQLDNVNYEQRQVDIQMQLYNIMYKEKWYK